MLALNDLILRLYSVEIHVSGTKAEKAARAALRAHGEFVDMYGLNRQIIGTVEAAGLHVKTVEQHDSFLRLYIEPQKPAPKGGGA